MIEPDVLEVTLLHGRDLAVGDSVLTGGKSDPYVLFSLAGSEEQRSSTQPNTLNPDWGDEGETFSFAFPEDDDACRRASDGVQTRLPVIAGATREKRRRRLAPQRRDRRGERGRVAA